MERELESVGQKLSQHRHLLIEVRPDLVGRFGDDIVAVGIDPFGAARDRSGIQIVGCRYESLDRVILRGELMRALHPDPPAPCVWSGWLDGRDLKFRKAWSGRSGLSEDATGHNGKNRYCGP